MPLVVVAPTTIPPALMFAVPPDIPRLPVMLPTLVSVPLVCNTFVAVPPVRFADPPLTVRAWSDALAVRFPELETVVVPPTISPLLIVVVPPERLAEPVMFPVLVTVPADWVRFVAVPPVKFAVPPLTVRAWSDAFEVNVPAETVVVPPTVAGDVAVVVPFVTPRVL